MIIIMSWHIKYSLQTNDIIQVLLLHVFYYLNYIDILKT
jgi:hypothetical protein